ncbi:MAG TPA: hypothetical protein VL356_09915 [Acidocella sp.]|jgi:hypothetical protein|nr:hypothetical protein [Acidocella sp.]
MHSTRIGGGEIGGAVLTEVNVVRGMTMLGPWNGAARSYMVPPPPGRILPCWCSGMMGASQPPRRTEPGRDENPRKRPLLKTSGGKTWLKLTGGAETAQAKQAETFAGSQKEAFCSAYPCRVQHARAGLISVDGA